MSIFKGKIAQAVAHVVHPGKGLDNPDTNPNYNATVDALADAGLASTPFGKALDAVHGLFGGKKKKSTSSSSTDRTSYSPDTGTTFSMGNLLLVGGILVIVWMVFGKKKHSR